MRRSGAAARACNTAIRRSGEGAQNRNTPTHAAEHRESKVDARVLVILERVALDAAGREVRHRDAVNAVAGVVPARGWGGGKEEAERRLVTAGATVTGAQQRTTG